MNIWTEKNDQGMVKFSAFILLFDLISLILACFLLHMMGIEGVFLSVLIAFAITSILAIISFYPFTSMRNGSMNRYMTAMLFGMLLRMVFIGLSVAIVFVFTEFHQIGFTVALLFSYICKSFIETYIIISKLRGQSSVL